MFRVAFNRTNHHANIKDGGARPVWVLLDDNGDQHLLTKIKFFGESWTDQGEYEKKLFSATHWIVTDSPVECIDETGCSYFLPREQYV